MSGRRNPFSIPAISVWMDRDGSVTVKAPGRVIVLDANGWSLCEVVLADYPLWQYEEAPHEKGYDWRDSDPA